MDWAPSMSGNFLLASAYQIARGGGSSSWLYSRLWLQGVPLKIWFFMLRLIETIDHIFCTGEVVRSIWGYFEEVIGGFGSSSMIRHKVVSWWLQPAQNPYLQYLFRLLPSLICWNLWKMRNKFVFEGQRLPVPHLCLFGMVAGLRKEYTTLVVHWNRPVPLVVKLNSDGCKRGNPGESGDGGMLRCSEGRLAISRRYVNLHIESDSLGLVQIIQGIVQCPWRLRRDLQDLLEDRRCFREVSHCFSEANKPADRLANIGVDSGSSCLAYAHEFQSIFEIEIVRGVIFA
ncbi:uncharacterized protein [Coffea arabica]|uniref:RNase H type-1 domain-containing protein n=1 Tax=Coffea arabica TaxID=13443 RepID=A0ABM4UYD9_COFAR